MSIGLSAKPKSRLFQPRESIGSNKLFIKQIINNVSGIFESIRELRRKINPDSGELDSQIKTNLSKLTRRLEDLNGQIKLTESVSLAANDITVLQRLQLDADLVFRNAHKFFHYDQALGLELESNLKLLKNSLTALLPKKVIEAKLGQVPQLSKLFVPEAKQEIKASGNFFRDVNSIFSLLVINDELSLDSKLKKANEFAESAIKNAPQEAFKVNRIDRAKEALEASLEYLSALPDDRKLEQGEAYTNLKANLQLLQGIKLMSITRVKTSSNGSEGTKKKSVRITMDEQLEKLFQELGLKLKANVIDTSKELEELKASLDKLIKHTLKEPEKIDNFKNAKPKKELTPVYIRIASTPKAISDRLQALLARFKKNIAETELREGSSLNTQRIALIEESLKKLDLISKGEYKPVTPKLNKTISVGAVLQEVERLLTVNEAHNSQVYFKKIKVPLDIVIDFAQKPDIDSQDLYNKLNKIYSRFIKSPRIKLSSSFNQERQKLLKAVLAVVLAQVTLRKKNNEFTERAKPIVVKRPEPQMDSKLKKTFEKLLDSFKSVGDGSKAKAHLANIKEQLGLLKGFAEENIINARVIFSQLYKIYSKFNQRVSQLKLIQPYQFDTERRNLLASALVNIHSIITKGRKYTDGKQKKDLDIRPIKESLNLAVDKKERLEIEDLLANIDKICRRRDVLDRGSVAVLRSDLGSLFAKLGQSKKKWPEVFDRLLKNVAKLSNIYKSKPNLNFREASFLSYLDQSLFKTLEISKTVAA